VGNSQASGQNSVLSCQKLHDGLGQQRHNSLGIVRQTEKIGKALAGKKPILRVDFFPSSYRASSPLQIH